MNKIRENWYKQILLLTEAIPLYQAKEYSRIATYYDKNLIEPVWDRIVQLGDFTSKRKERVYFEFDVEKFDIPEVDSVRFDELIEMYTLELLGEFIGLLEAGIGLYIKNNNHKRYTNLFKNNPIGFDKLILDLQESWADHFSRRLRSYQTDLLGDNDEDTFVELDEYGSMVDIVLGIVILGSPHREYRLGKIVELLRDKVFKGTKYADQLKKVYTEFTTKKSNMPVFKAGHLIVVSRHPYDIAGMSTGRGWDSCMTLPSPDNPRGGVEHPYIECDVAEGTFIAYLIKATDLNIENPVGRAVIKPYYSKNNDAVIYKPDDRTYGTVPFSFIKAVRTIFERATPKEGIPAGVYTLPKNLYSDYKYRRSFEV